MKSICRPFILYTDFLPPSHTAHKNWQYMSWGYFDGISVEKNLFEDGKYDFNKLWEFSGKQKEQFDGSFSQQIVFGFRSEEDTAMIDKKFWNERLDTEEYPFVFLCLLQSDQKGETLKDSWEKRLELETKLSVENQQKAITYLTLDHSDLLLVLRCKSYNKGAETIDSFHRRDSRQASRDNLAAQFSWSHRYSFTIAGVDKELMDQERIDCGSEVVDNAYIFGIERNPGSVNCIYQELKNSDIAAYIAKEKQAIPGFNDELIVLSQVPWKKFLNLYKTHSGILNHTNSLYQSCLIGATTILGKIQPDIPAEAEENKRRERSAFIKKLWEDCMALQIGDKVDAEQNRSIKQALCSIINSMEKFEDSPFAEYIFISTFQPVRMLIDLLREGENEEKRKEIYNSFYEFLKGFSLYAQNSVRSDRQLIQTPDFNLRLYEIPARMNSFYNAFIYSMKCFLNNSSKKEGSSEHFYEFLTCPGMNSNMQVEELFTMISTKQRLFLVDIPEHQAYDPQLMMIMLGHEVGHFVGSEMRSRDIRYKYILKGLARVFSRYLKQELIEGYGKKNAREYMNEELYWEGHLEKKLFQYMDELYGVKKEDRNGLLQMEESDVGWAETFLENYGHHSRVMCKLLPDIMTRVICENKEVLFSYLYEQEFQCVLADAAAEEDLENRMKEAVSRKKDLQEMIGDLADSFVGYDAFGKERLNEDFAVNMLVGFTKECVADLMGILSLRLSASEYLRSIMKNIQEQGRAGKIRDSHMLRVMLVTRSMICVSDRKEPEDYYWEDEELMELQIGSNGIDELARFTKELVKRLNLYFGAETEESLIGETPADGKGPIAAFYDFKVLDYLAKYLLSCRRLFYENQKEQSLQKKKEQEKLFRMYHIFDEEDIENVIGQMQICIDEYRDRVREELC